MELFFIVISLLYFLTNLLLLRGLKKSLKLTKEDFSNFPKVSVIVAGRNEEKNIVRCIRSLSKLSYPQELFEVILVNDNSTDKTYELMKESTKDLKIFRVINSRKNSSKNLKGKANAIDSAIEICSGDIILSTDADCEVQSNWIKETVKYYSEHTGMVCGFTMMKFGKSLFAKLQCIDWLYLLTLASSSTGLNMTLSCVGNNLSFSKKCYRSVGGYESINFSVTEDFALMRKVSSDRNYQIKFPVNTNCLVESLPCENFSEVFSQKRRWFRGGIGINFLGYIVGFEIYIVNFLLIFGLFFISYKIYFILLLIRMYSELMLFSKILNRFDFRVLYGYYPLFIFYFAIYGLMLPWSFLFSKKIKWKGQKF